MKLKNITDMMRVFYRHSRGLVVCLQAKDFRNPTLFLGSCDLQYHSLRGVLDPNYTDDVPGSYNKSTISAKAEKIWESVGDKIIDIVEDITTSEDFLTYKCSKRDFR